MHELPRSGTTLKNGHGCESCHGPGGEHVAGGGDKTKIVRFSELSRSEVNTRCREFTAIGASTSMRNCYQYGEKDFVGPTSPRYFHANEVTLSLRYAF